MKLRFSHWIPPLALLAACLLAFGAAVPFLGLFSDDWPFLYLDHIGGVQANADFLARSRPAAGWIYGWVSALLGTRLWLHHLAVILLRWVDSVLLWQVMLLVFPRRRSLALAAALLFAVYPAFKQMPLALEYILHFFSLSLLLGSILAMVRLALHPPANRSAAWGLGALAWLGSFQLFIVEYFFGLELLRPVLLWLALGEGKPRREMIKPALLLWLPYLPVVAGFLFWRMFLLGFATYQPELLNTGAQSGPLAALLDLLRIVPRDLFTITAGAWLQLLEPPDGRRAGLAWIVVIVASMLVFAAFLWLYRRSAQNDDKASGDTSFSAPLACLLTGLLGLLLAGPPFWVTRLPLALTFPWDRTTLAFLPAASIFTAGFIELAGSFFGRLFARTKPQLAAYTASAALLAVFLAFSTGLHFQNFNAYRKEWSLLPPFFWQLTWRIPSLAPGTALIIDQPPFNYHVDRFLAPLVNWTFAPESRSRSVPYTLVDFHKLWGKALPPAAPDAPIHTDYWILQFDGTVDQALVIVYAPPGCLRVLTPREETHLLMSPELQSSLHLTDLSLIGGEDDFHAAPPDFLGPEPEHGWCYYFEKAELAAQRSDWAAAADFGDQAFSAGHAPGQPSENPVFAEAFARTNRWEDAHDLINRTSQAGEFYRRAACAAWKHVQQETGQFVPLEACP